MDILLLRGFNNYFNRVVKKYSTLADYRAHSASYIDLSGVNFNPNDGVVTELVLGGPTQLENNAVFAWDANGTPDYLITYEGNAIKSRWFVLESERTRAGQYRLALKHDLIAENYDNVMNAPCFVEKGVVSSASNPLIYNNESMTYNQIKKQEISLKDATGSGWIVGYLAKNRANETHNISTSVAILDGVPTEYIDSEDLPFSVSTTAGTTVYNYIRNSLTTAVAAAHIQSGSWSTYYIQQGWKLNNFGTTTIKVSEASDRAPSFIDTGSTIPQSGALEPATSTDVYNYLATNGFDKFKSSNSVSFYDNAGNVVFTAAPVGTNGYVNLLDKYCYYAEWGSPSTNYVQAVQQDASVYNSIAPLVDLATEATLNTEMASYATVTSSDIRALYDGKYVKVGDEYYRMSISETGVSRYDIFTSTDAQYRPAFSGANGNIVSLHANSTIGSKLTGIITSQSGTYAGAVNTDHISSSFIVAQSKGYSVVLSKLSVETLNLTMNAGKRVTYDCVADVFAIPYGEMKYKLVDSGDTYTTSRDEGLAIARAIAQELGDTVCYDLQLVPYVPSALVRELMAESDTLCLDDLEPANYDLVTKTFSGETTNATFVLYVSSAKGTFDIPVTLNPKDFGYSALMNKKLSNETELCRLVSPNFNSMFEFSLAKNDGITKVNVDYTYKPYMPYIHMNPDFKSIYGKDWDDARGLILGGDYSLAFLNSAWTNYQNNNKNYQAIFNRQIENMDVNNQIAKEQLDWQTTAGYFTGGISGAVGGGLAGAKAGGPGGAIAGAAGGAYFGTVGAVVGGGMDKEWLARQQAENKDYAQDMYGYHLGNIQAQPYSLARSESLTNNHKIFPLIEVYECTDEEAVNLFNKLKYNGMTIMAIGKLADFAKSADIEKVYVKGQIIRIESINDDFHVSDAIYSEVNKGFFVTEGEQQ